MAANAKVKSMTKSAVLQELAAKTDLTRKQMSDVFEALTNLIKGQLGKKGPGQFTIPGLIKLRLVKKPPTKARPGINPATKQPIMIAAKPATTVVRARVLKQLKEMVK
jgi:nucleoid DNA-binding protein